MGKLIFVYNAKEDLLNKAIDFGHKIISPSTYGCELCAVTHGTFTIKKEWADYLQQLPMEKEFLYSEKWAKMDYYADEALPAIFYTEQERSEPVLLISKRELQQIRQVEELIRLLELKLKAVLSPGR